MKKYIFYTLLFIVSLNSMFVWSQTPKKIIIEHADFADINQFEIPDAALLTGNVKINHDGVVLTCNKAYYFQKENYVKAFGDVRIVQGDTIAMTSKYAEYSGNAKQAFATGEVLLKSSEMSIATDTLNFDRNKQEAFYNSNGIIINKENILKSKKGRYFIKEKKYQFKNEVIITTPTNKIQSNHLDYYTDTGHTYLLGPSTIIGKENKIYTKKGFYDTKKDIAQLQRGSKIKYDNKIIQGDSLYYNKKTGFASATNNIKITDTVNKIIIKGHYAEIYKQKDSMFVSRKALAISIVENDSVYIHAKKLMITGKIGSRIIRGFNNARFFKKDMSGKCDSIHSDQKNALTKLMGNPVIWNFENQMTGDVIHLIGNNKTQKLDSLKVLNNAFIISKDTIGNGYNQVKGQNLYGELENNKLKKVDLIKNTEVIYFMRNEKNELIGINKSACSKINLVLENNKINSLTLYEKSEGEIFPEKELPENARKLRGFVWRGDERIKTVNDIFTKEELAIDSEIQKAIKKQIANEIEDEIEYELDTFENKKFSLNEIFEKFENRIIIDNNQQWLLVKNGKFKFPLNPNSFKNYQKKYPKYAKTIKLNQLVWDTHTMINSPYDGGNFDEVIPPTKKEIEKAKAEEQKKLFYENIFKNYNNRIIEDINGQLLLVKNGKFKFPLNPNSFKKYQKKYPKYSKIVKINKQVWDNHTMINSPFDGGNFDVK